MEGTVIINKVFPSDVDIDKKKKKGEIVSWSEAMRRFNISGEELKDIIEKGTCVSNSNVDYFLDYALSY